MTDAPDTPELPPGALELADAAYAAARKIAGIDLIERPELPPLPNTLQLMKCGEALVTLHADGSMTFGPSYTPDEAARVFWSAMGGYHTQAVREAVQRERAEYARLLDAALSDAIGATLAGSSFTHEEVERFAPRALAVAHKLKSVAAIRERGKT